MTAEYASATPEERASRVVRVSDVPVVNLMPGANSHIVAGTRMTLSFVTLEADRYYPIHSHPHEQMVIVLKGEIDAVVEGYRYRVREGEVVPISGGVAHGTYTLGQQCVILEVFSPARAEFEEKLLNVIGVVRRGGSGPTASSRDDAILEELIEHE